MLWVFFFSGNLLSYPEVWGFLIAGKFYIDIVPEGEVVDQFYYAELLEEKLDHWKGHCDKLIQDLSFWQLPYLWCKGAGPKSFFFFSHERICQDHERCLRATESLQAMETIGVALVREYPKSSQDLNPVENVWNILRELVNMSQPVAKEERADFEIRLKAAVNHLNTQMSDSLKDLWLCQKKRAKLLLEATPPGSRLAK